MNVLYNFCVCALYLTLSDMIGSPPPSPQSNLNCVEKKMKMGIRRVMTKHIKTSMESRRLSHHHFISFCKKKKKKQKL